MKRFLPVAVSFAALAACLVSAPAFAQSGYTFQSPTEQYLSLRRVSPPAPGLSLDVLAKSPGKFRGQTAEVSGKLLGIVRTDEGARLLLKTDRHGTLTLTMSVVPSWVQSGARLRALVVVGGDENALVEIGLPEMNTVAVASALDIETAELEYRQGLRTRRVVETKKTKARQTALGRLSAPPRFRGTLASRKSGGRSAPSLASNGGLSGAALDVFPAYRAFIQNWNPNLPSGDVDAIAFAILDSSEKMDVDPRLVVAVIIAESDFRPGLVSHAGAQGLGQIMPGTAREVPGLTNPFDPVQNVQGTVYLLKERLDKYSGGKSSGDLNMKEIVLALAAYNAGMGAVKKYGGVPPYRETQNYVKKIERIYRSLCGEG